MDIGKLPPDMLKRVVFDKIAKNGIKRKEVVVGSAMGEDCTALLMGDELCVLSSDPVTGAAKDIGFLAVHVNVNDVAASGCEPVGVMMTLLVPPTTSESLLADIMDGAILAANQVGIAILGGHTEVSDAVNRPIVSATIVGKTHGKAFVSTGGAQIGDELVMSKWAGLEGSGILASHMEGILTQRLGNTMVAKAKEALGLISVLPEARIAMEVGVSAMHDATEGGILGACYEMAEGAKMGIDVHLSAIAVLPETAAICATLGINPLRLVASGSLLMTTANGEKLVNALAEANIHAAIIGRITAHEKIYYDHEGSMPLAPPQGDELYKAMVF